MKSTNPTLIVICALNRVLVLKTEFKRLRAKGISNVIVPWRNSGAVVNSNRKKYLLEMISEKLSPISPNMARVYVPQWEIMA